MNQHNFYGKPYYSLDAWCKENYGHKLYKIALDIGCSCPNRDGTISTGGCIFCSEGGSGDFAGKLGAGSTTFTRILQVEKQRLIDKWPDIGNGQNIIAYFQSYTNTYGNVEHLRTYFHAALSDVNVAGISIGTRPDCLGEEVMGMLEGLRDAFPEKFIWIELGLQTIHESTAVYINRGYAYDVFKDAVERLKQAKLPFIVHLILGLPGETAEMVLGSIDEMNRIKPFGIKLQLLHVLEGTELGEQYKRGEIDVFTREEYLDLLCKCIRQLDPEICIHRVTGDGPKDILLAPNWSRNKRGVLNDLHRRLCYNE